jgi:hypothetical protein
MANDNWRDELKKVINFKSQPSTSINEFDLADKLSPIEQNFKDGQGGRQMQPQFKGKSTMDLVISGDRTRTTRANNDIQRMARDYSLSKISDLVGKVIRMTDKTGRQVYTRITKVAQFTQEYQDATWQKEGWAKSVTDKNVGNYPYAIEFEVVTPTQLSTQQQANTSDDTKTPREGLNERLDNYGYARIVLSSDFNEGVRPKGRLNAFKEAIRLAAQNPTALMDINLNEFDFITNDEKKRLDNLRPLAEEFQKINLLISGAEFRTVAVEKRFAQLTNQLTNEFVDIVGKHVEQQLGKTISSSKPRIITQQQAPVSDKNLLDEKLINYINSLIPNYIKTPNDRVRIASEFASMFMLNQEFKTNEQLLKNYMNVEKMIKDFTPEELKKESKETLDNILAYAVIEKLAKSGLSEKDIYDNFFGTSGVSQPVTETQEVPDGQTSEAVVEKIEDRLISINQYTFTIKPDGKMFYANGDELTDKTIMNKVNIRKELQDGTLRMSNFNNSNYYILSDNTILGSGTTNLAKETIADAETKRIILDRATTYKPKCN